MLVSWIHVSDFHFTHTDPYDRNVVLRALTREIQRRRANGFHASMIFATGDIAHSGQKEEYVAASAFFNSLLEAAGLRKNELFVVPGNHDVDRGAARGLSRTLESEQESVDYFGSQHPPYHFAKLANFRTWFNQYFRGIRECPPISTCHAAELINCSGARVRVLPINSALFSVDESDHGKLWIGRRNLDEVISSLDDTRGPDLAIALLHHPLEWLHDGERANIKAVLRQHFDVILRGHLHETDLEFTAGLSAGAAHLAAGAAYQTRKWPNRALLCTVDLDKGRLTVLPMRYEDTPNAAWTVDTSLFPTSNDYQGSYDLPRLSARTPVEVTGKGGVRTASPGSAAAVSGMDVQLAAHRKALAAIPSRYRGWWQKAIPLQVTSLKGSRGEDAREVLAGWLTARQNRHCVVLGQPGAGKTGLLRWLAAKVAEMGEEVPLLIPASKLRELRGITLSDLARAAEPPLDPLATADLANRTLYLLLDGLDELVGAEQDGDRIASRLLSEALAAVPLSSRVVAACRTPIFSLIGESFKRDLSMRVPTESDDDPYEIAMRRALGISGESVLVLTLQPVAPSEAEAFLARSELDRDLIQTAMSSKAIAPFLSSPFMIRMLQTALPHLAQMGSIALGDLYRNYVEAALLREDPNLSSSDLDAITADLRQLACKLKDRLEARHERLAQRVDILARTERGYAWSHYSIWEYFFASELLNQLCNMDSRMLSRLDLVGGYNINRMLVPMVIQTLDQKSNGLPTKVRAVSSEEYRAYLAETGWRRGHGYGIHPSMMVSDDGTPSANFHIEPNEPASIHRDDRHGDDIASALSWYDAAVFAMHAGVRLPTRTQVSNLANRGRFLFWTCEWHSEESAHIGVFDAAENETLGLNPDVRLPRTALAVVG